MDRRSGVKRLLKRLSAALPLLLICFCSVCGQTPASPASQKIQALSQRLTSGDDEQRRDAALQLGLIRTRASSLAALPALSDPTPMVRAIAALAVAHLKDDNAVDAIAKLLVDKFPFVRREAAYALGLTHNRKATSPLMAVLLNDKDDEVRAAAAVALGELRDEAAVPLLVSIIAPSTTQNSKSRVKLEPNFFVVRAAAISLGRIGSRAATPALIATLQNEKYPDDLKREAAAALGSIGDTAAIDALKNAALSEDPYLATAAQQSLRKLTH